MLHDAGDIGKPQVVRAAWHAIPLLQVPVDPATMKADVRATARAMSANTIMIYASAPSFPHGVIDPVEDLARLATKYGVSSSRTETTFFVIIGSRFVRPQATPVGGKTKGGCHIISHSSSPLHPVANGCGFLSPSEALTQAS